MDIETTGFNGLISVIGLYKPKQGVVEYDCYVRGFNLNRDELKKALQGCMMLITYNGITFDIPRVKKEFPGIIPDDIPVIDLYRFARRLGMNTNLQVLENTYRIERLDDSIKKMKIATRLWRRFEIYRDGEALKSLIAYNRQDTVNLYPLAESLYDEVYRQVCCRQSMQRIAVEG